MSGPMRVIGLTGAPGSGKTAAGLVLKDLGAELLGLDDIGHEILRRPEVREEVRRVFSAGVLQVMDGEVSRRKLGGLVFGDPEELRKLCKVLHPRMAAAVRERAGAVRAGPGTVPLVVEGALLVEMDLARDCDRVVLVRAPRDERVRRLARLRGWDEEELDRRERAQKSDAEKERVADVVLENDSTLENLREKVSRLWEEWT